MKKLSLLSINKPKNAINKSLIKDFVSGNNKFMRYVIGKNEQSALIINKFSVDGIIDDFSDENAFWNSVQFIKMSKVPENAIVINCSSSICPNSVINKLLSLGIKNIIGYYELAYYDKLIPFPHFVKEMREDYRMNAAKWESLYSRFEDDESRRVLVDIMRYRCTGDSAFMENFSVRLNDQYFEDFMAYRNEVFADIGGFDGDTTEEFCIRYPDYEKVFLFEPSQINMNDAKRRLKEFRNIYYVNYGLSDSTDTFYFNQGNGSASSISESGDTQISVSTLDELVKQPISVIKMDIEGFEMSALRGCYNHILNDKPKLAIAVYHKSKDFWEIPDFIFSINPDYKIYLRHYTEGWSETVMYFVLS